MRTGCGWLGKAINEVTRMERAKASKMDQMLHDLFTDVDPAHLRPRDLGCGIAVEHFLCRSTTWPRYVEYCRGVLSNFGECAYSMVASQESYVRWADNTLGQDSL